MKSEKPKKAFPKKIQTQTMKYIFANFRREKAI